MSDPRKPEDRKGPRDQKNAEARQKSIWREYTEAIVIALILALIIRTFIVQAFKIPSSSMVPTLLIGDHLLVNKFIYRFRDPERGDVVVFKFPKDRKTDFIKRVIAVPGQKVEIIDRKVYVDDKPIAQDYAYYHDSRQGDEITLSNAKGLKYHYMDTNGSRGPAEFSLNWGPVTVSPGNILVMGDNRDNSYDGRFWGTVPLKDVVGKAMIIYWSWGGTILDKSRWMRIGDLIR